MKIIIIDNSLNITGAFKAVFNNITADNGSNEFIFFIPSTSKNKLLLESKGYQVYTFTSYELSRHIKNIVLYLPLLFWNAYRLANIVRKQEIPVIYQNEIFILSGIVAKLFVKVKVVSHFRVMPTIFPKKLYRFWLLLHDRYADKILTVSFACQKAAMQLYNGKNKIEVLYDFILPSPNYPSYEVKAQGPFSILFIGNYTRGKGHDLAIHAIKYIQDHHSDINICLRMYGSDFGYTPNVAYRQSLLQYIKDNSLEGKVEINDFTKDIEKVILDHDLLLNLSIAESFSFVVAEAMHFGIPVLATNSGGPGELLEDKNAGELVPFCPKTIAERIVFLLQHPSIRQLYSVNQQQRIRSLIEEYGGSGRLITNIVYQ